MRKQLVQYEDEYRDHLKDLVETILAGRSEDKQKEARILRGKLRAKVKTTRRGRRRRVPLKLVDRSVEQDMMAVQATLDSMEKEADAQKEQLFEYAHGVMKPVVDFFLKKFGEDEEEQAEVHEDVVLSDAEDDSVAQEPADKKTDDELQDGHLKKTLRIFKAARLWHPRLIAKLTGPDDPLLKLPWCRTLTSPR